MNMQQMMIQAQRMQRELQKAKNELAKKEFSLSKGGAITITMLGSHEIIKVNIDKDALDIENKEMIEEMIALTINELNTKIFEEENKIESKLTGRSGGMGF